MHGGGAGKHQGRLAVHFRVSHLLRTGTSQGRDDIAPSTGAGESRQELTVSFKFLRLRSASYGYSSEGSATETSLQVRLARPLAVGCLSREYQEWKSFRRVARMTLS